jgi:hypothetical protein
MISKYKGIVLSALFSLAVIPSWVQADISDRVEISGFGRVMAGYLDEKSAEFEGYSNHLSFSQQSLLALQADATITDSLSLSGQLLAHTADDRDSGLEWLYLNYEPNQNWRFKAGKLRTPFFRYTDVIDVGFSYPWITPPQQVYGGFFFSNYEGATATHIFHVGDINFDVEGYYGVFKGEFSREGQSVQIDIDEIKGLILSVNKGNLSVRISAMQSSDFDANVPAFTQFADSLELAGFKDNADSLRFDGEATGYQASVNYDHLDYFIAAEWVKITSDLFVVPELDGYYLSAGYNFSTFQAHATFSNSTSSYNTSENLIPKGVSPQLDQLSFAYDQVTSNLPLYDLDSISFGIRWDFLHNMSAKAEITFLKGEPGKNSFYSEINDPAFDREATLYQFGVEWIF